MASLNEIQINEFTVPILTQIGEGRRGRIKRVQKVQRVHRVQRGWWAPLWTRPAGVRVQKVQKVQKVQRVKVGGCAASFYKTFTTALAGEGKQANRPVGDKNAPLLVLTHYLSPKGKHVTGFSGRYASLQIQFLCHPGGGTFPAAKQ